MGLVLLLVGLLMVITGGRGTYAQFGTLVASEFTGPIIPSKGTPSTNFTTWLLAIGMIGSLGYISALQTISRLFMVLILLAIFLGQKGFFAQFSAALKAGPKAPNALPASSSQTSVSPNASTATIDSAIKGNQTGPFGSPPQTEGQAKAFGWFNYLFGNSTSSGVSQ